MRRILPGLLLFSLILFSSCARMFLPQKQKITITTPKSESEIYVNNKLIGKGTSASGRIAKDGSKQIIIRTKGYKDNYSAVIQDKRCAAYYIIQAIELIPTFGMGNLSDLIATNSFIFKRNFHVPLKDQLINRESTEKYIDITSVKVDIKDKTHDFRYFILNSPNLTPSEMEKAEKKGNTALAKLDVKKSKKKKEEKTLDEEKGYKLDDTQFTERLHKTLKNTGFVDTVNKIFLDNNNTLVLEGKIKKVHIYTYQSYLLGSISKCKMFLTWYIKNPYGELLDSIDTKELSGEFIYSYFDQMYNDAVDVSYLSLRDNPKFTKYLKQNISFSNPDPLLSIKAPSKNVLNKEDAALASVIVKREDGGHGSGFAISDDGYIVTNYHVVANNNTDKPNQQITIITSTGEELKGTVVRSNKLQDLALIRVNKTFERAFKLPTEKTFRNFQDVYTIGAPMSIELGQSLSSGIISNERKNNNNYLLQLSMALNRGNSGGPVFDNTGSLQGVVVAKLVGQNVEGISFAIPGYLVEEYLKLRYN